MPRTSRKKSSLNCYHIISRGINKQDIFFDDNDKKKFIKEIIRTKEKYKYKLYAYVLMQNHVHLLVQEKDSNISNIMKSILVSYAQYINKKYERIGYVFEDRFHSRPIEDDNYLKNVIRYIHLNPQKAGISAYDRYEWSSYKEYEKKESNLISNEIIKNKFAPKNEQFMDKFQKFHEEKKFYGIDDGILEYEIKKVLDDAELYHILEENFGKQLIGKMQCFQKEYREKILMQIFEIKGINCAQISRVTGINRKLVYNCRERYLKLKKK